MIGLSVCNEAKATLVGCTVKNVHNGIQICDQATAEVLHCTISDTGLLGATVFDKGSSLTLKYSSLLRCKDDGVLVHGGGTATIDNCHIQECGFAGIGAEGPSRSNVAVTDTVMTECVCGLIVQTGKSDVVAKRCKLVRNTTHGLVVGEDAVGEVVVSECEIEGNLLQDIVVSGHRPTIARAESCPR